MLKGLNLDATIALANEISIPVIASGGLASIEDVHALMEPRASRLANPIAMSGPKPVLRPGLVAGDEAAS